MSDFSSNAPIMQPESKPGPAGWVAVWIKAVTKPNEQAFVEITESPEAVARTAYIWVFIAGTVTGIVQALIRTISLAAGLTPQLPIPGLEQYMPQAAGGGDASSIGISLLIGICTSPIAGLLTVVFFALGVAIIQWIAKLFGGTGSYEKLAYAFAAITVPMSLVSVVLAFINIIPYIGLCGSVLSLGLGIYALYLQITATKAVNRFGWGQAVGSVLIPGAVVLTLCCCIIFGGAMLLGPAIGNVFKQINPNLAP